ncbi:MAG: DUF885 domain-containing protein [Acidimicrobiales bacterium]
MTEPRSAGAGRAGEGSGAAGVVPAPGASGRGLDALLDSWMRQELDAEPVTASGLGLVEHDGRLPDRSAGSWQLREQRDRECVARLEAVADEGLSIDQRIDRDALIAALSGREVLAGWQEWRRDPGLYTEPGLMGVFVLFAHGLRPLPELVGAATARLAGVGELLSQGRANLDAGLAHPMLLRRAVAQARAGASYCHALPSQVGGDGTPELADAAGAAAESFAGFAEHLDDLASRATGEWAIGEQRYTDLLRRRELLVEDAARLSESGAAAWEEIGAAMEELAGRAARAAGLDPESLPPGPARTRWSAVLAALNDDHAGDFDELLVEYTAATRRARSFLVENDVVTLPPGEECEVEPAPGFRRAILAVASYMAPPAFGASRAGRFFVPFPPGGIPPEEVAQRLRTNSRASIPTITTHETYPGHHWHLSTAQSGGRRIRQLVRTPYFSEGWALFAERVMASHGYFEDPRHHLAHLDARLFRAARIVVDVGLHTGELSVEAAVEHMVRRANLSPSTARAEVTRYCAWPTQAASYLTGALEIERLSQRWLAEGRGSLKGFCDRLAATGSLPPSLAASSVFASPVAGQR